MLEENIITLIKCVETIDNWGRVHVYKDAELFKLVSDSAEWTDDQVFYDANGRQYFIDELIGERVNVGPISFVVQES